MSNNHSIRTVHLGNVKYVTGLYWQMLDDVAHPKKEIVQKGQDVDADLVCVPVTTHPLQAGYASRYQLGSRELLRSLAAGLVEMNAGSWLGLFEIPGDGEHYYYIAIKDDHIHAESDLVLPRAKAIDIFEKMLSFGGWLYASVPPNLSFAGTQINHLSLEDALAKHRAPKLKPLVFKYSDLPIKKIAVGLGIVLSLSGAYVAYDMIDAERQIERAKAEQAERDAERKKREAAAKVVVPPWLKAVGNHAFLTVCQSQWTSVSYVIAGWELKTWSCDAHATVTSYEPIAMTSAAPLMVKAPSVSFSPDMKKATLSKPLAMSIQGVVPPALQNKGGKAMLIDFSERHLLQFTAVPVVLPPPLPGAEKTAVPVPTWVTEKVTLVSTYPVFELINSALEVVPGFAITKIMVSNAGEESKWSIEGELYGK